jgi:hypothetical protein
MFVMEVAINGTLTQRMDVSLVNPNETLASVSWDATSKGWLAALSIGSTRYQLFEEDVVECRSNRCNSMQAHKPPPAANWNKARALAHVYTVGFALSKNGQPLREITATAKGLKANLGWHQGPENAGLQLSMLRANSFSETIQLANPEDWFSLDLFAEPTEDTRSVA